MLYPVFSPICPRNVPYTMYGFSHNSQIAVLTDYSAATFACSKRTPERRPNKLCKLLDIIYALENNHGVNTARRLRLRTHFQLKCCFPSFQISCVPPIPLIDSFTLNLILRGLSYFEQSKKQMSNPINKVLLGSLNNNRTSKTNIIQLFW